jgi:hypothetical protein
MGKLKDLFLDKAEQLSQQKYNKPTSELNPDQLTSVYKQAQQEVDNWLRTEIDKERERIKYGN